MSDTPGQPRGRILIVEDEAMVAMLLEDMLSDLGYEPVGPAGRLDEALRLASEESVSAAILDLNLHGQDTYAVAELLRNRGVPFIFATGYGANALSPGFQSARTLQKPFLQDDLDRALSAVLAAG